MEHADRLALSLAGLFVLGTTAQWIASRLRLPSILFLLAFGILAGPVTGWIRPDEMFGQDLLFPIVSLAVAVILFEGALSLKFRDLREIGRVMLSLLTVGVLVTWLLTTALAHWVLQFGWSVSLLLGAILVVTGPTVIGPLLRQIRPIGRVGPISRWEGIVIDPIGAVLAVLVFEASSEIHLAGLDGTSWEALTTLLKTIVVGVGCGMAAAWAVAALLRRHELPDHLQSPVTLMFVLAAFALSNLLQHESGLVAVTVMGVVLANSRGIDIHHILEFKEALSLLLISILFILLSARLEFDDFLTLGWRGLVFLTAMLLIVRPVSVFVSTAGSNLSVQEKLLLSWLAPRGIVAAAVSSIFALQMQSGGEQLVSATFLTIIGTVSVYGFTAFPLAKRLKLASDDPQGVLIAGAHAGARAIATALQSAGFHTLLVDVNARNIQAARMEGLPTKLGDVLSERLVEELDLGGIGRLLALTPNDEVNSLAAIHLRLLFGRSNCYQLAPQLQQHESETTSTHVRARTLFDNQATGESLHQRFAAGAVVKATKLSDEFTLADFRARYGEQSLILFLITETNRLVIVAADDTVTPTAGQTVIALVDPPQESADEHR